MILWGYWRSSCTWRVRLGLAVKGLAYEHRPVDLRAGSQHDAAHTSRNVLAQVPVLEVDGRRLTQSLAILAWLDEQVPTPPLLPAHPWARARAREIAEILNAGTQPLQNLATVRAFSADGGDGRAFAATAIRSGLTAVEAILTETSDRFCVGDTLTIADLCLVPQLYNARRFEVDLAPFQNTLRVEAAAAALPAFQDAHPDRFQPSERS